MEFPRLFKPFLLATNQDNPDFERELIQKYKKTYFCLLIMILLDQKIQRRLKTQKNKKICQINGVLSHLHFLHGLKYMSKITKYTFNKTLILFRKQVDSLYDQTLKLIKQLNDMKV
jgi:hypothetical protein